MEQKEIIAIFNEMLTKVFSEQEQKYKKKKKYNLEQYCCSEEEKNQFSAIFEGLLDMAEILDVDSFIAKFSEEEE